MHDWPPEGSSFNVRGLAAGFAAPARPPRTAPPHGPGAAPAASNQNFASVTSRSRKSRNTAIRLEWRSSSG